MAGDFKSECRYRLNEASLDIERFDSCRQRHGEAIVIIGGSHGIEFF